MVNIAYSDCSADGNSGLRQVLLFFLEYFGSYEENQGECSLDQFFSGKNRARTHFIVSINSFFHALSKDIHIDMHFGILGSTQAPSRCGAIWKLSPTVTQKDDYILDYFFYRKTHFIESINSSFHALSNDTHIDMHHKNPGLTQSPLRCGAVWKESPTVAQQVPQRYTDASI